MSKLRDFISIHVQRGDCTCGKCIDAPENPEDKQPNGHAIDLTFFEMSLVCEPNKEEFEELVKAEFPQWLDGKEHNYIEIGGDLGDQGYALMCIGLGHLLGLWKALTPDIVIPGLPEDLKMKMAGMGMIALQANTG